MMGRMEAEARASAVGRMDVRELWRWKCVSSYTT